MQAVAEAFLFSTGRTALALCFDEAGASVVELQGPRTPELVERIRTASTPATRWYGWGEAGPLCWDQSATAAFVALSQG